MQDKLPATLVDGTGQTGMRRRPGCPGVLSMPSGITPGQDFDYHACSMA
ncbi:MAG: hypothetical protein WCH04_06860 [Gammaproteobacteria bacterium]